MCVLAVTLVLVCKYRPRTVPLEECSQLYRTYADDPHIAAAYIHNLRVNDTLTVDATLLHALDSTGWHRLMLDFGFPSEMIDYYYKNPPAFMSGNIDKTNPKIHPPFGDPNCELLYASPKEQTFCIYHTNLEKVGTSVFKKEVSTVKNKKNYEN